tara:strand:- start:78 stop:272 length:195 start_codon:yes stop_codon:yes gene_type:complete
MIIGLSLGNSIIDSKKILRVPLPLFVFFGLLELAFLLGGGLILESSALELSKGPLFIERVVLSF